MKFVGTFTIIDRGLKCFIEYLIENDRDKIEKVNLDNCDDKKYINSSVNLSNDLMIYIPD